jgi:hypothetical protein
MEKCKLTPKMKPVACAVKLFYSSNHYFLCTLHCECKSIHNTELGGVKLMKLCSKFPHSHRKHGHFIVMQNLLTIMFRTSLPTETVLLLKNLYYIDSYLSLTMLCIVYAQFCIIS